MPMTKNSTFVKEKSLVFLQLHEDCKFCYGGLSEKQYNSVARVHA
jgi:hypothetical protein